VPISQRDLANAVHVPYYQVNELVNALRLAKFFGVSADFWLNLQVRWDLHKAQVQEEKELEVIESFHHLQKIA